MNTKLIIWGGIILLALNIACTKEFLNVIPDKSLAIPRTPADVRAIMDNTTKMNIYYPSTGEIAADNYYIASTAFNALTQITPRNAYIWHDDVFNDKDNNDWSYPYVTIFNANVVLEAISDWDENVDVELKNELVGSALFFRAYAFFSLSQLFCKPYDPASAAMDLGIPLRLDADLNKTSIRASLAETYAQILNDTKAAVGLLPNNVEMKTRPNKAAALGLLSRVYLIMGDYASALVFADSCIETTAARLIDYNTISSDKANPFPRFNEEVIFHSALLGQSILQSLARIDTAFYDTYEDTDLRKSLYFAPASDRGHRFRGSYDGSVALFSGLALDEIYFIKAECEIRTGNMGGGRIALMQILEERYVSNLAPNVSAMEDNELLGFCLDHRRKELLMRGIRWSDLRRLSKDPEFAVELVRQIDGEQYVLPPNDSRYVFPIPDKVIQMTGMKQNQR